MDQELQEAPYHAYMAQDRKDSGTALECFRGLEALLGHMPPYEHDAVMDILCRLISETERTAFLEGVWAGTRLASQQKDRE